MEPELQRIKKKLKKLMDKERYQHTLGVMYTAASMAMAYGRDVNQAMLAGLLHDCGKPMSEEEQKNICKKAGVKISNAEAKNYRLLHAKTGMILAQERYDVKDSDVLDAIRYHTTGHPNMTELEQIIYIADYIEPNRTLLSNMMAIRKLAFYNLNECTYRLAKDSLTYLTSRNQVVDETTVETYKFYEQFLTEEQKKHALSL